MFKTYLYSSLVFTLLLSILSVFVITSQSQSAMADDKGEATAPIALSAAAKIIAPTTVADAPNVSTIDDKIFFAGQPTAASLLSFREKGVETIINLRMEQEMASVDFDEAKLVESLGMKYINIPIGGQEVSEETMALLMNTIEESSTAPMLMHCASSNRVGYVWSIFRATRGGESLEAAIEQGKQAGMSSPALQERASQTISQQPTN